MDAGFFTPFHAFRWTQATGPVDLGTLDSPNNASRSSSALSANQDCSVIAGISDTAGGAVAHAFRWTAAGGMADLGAPAGAARASRAFGVSADGAVVVGDAEFTDAASFSGFRSGAFRWSGGSFEALGSLTAGFPSLATATSADAATIVGGASVAAGATTTGQQAFRWTQAAGMVALGSLPGVAASMATAVSDDGRVITGTTSTAGGILGYRGSLGFDRGDGAFRWTEATGMRDLRQLLVDAGADLTGLTLNSVSGMSPDGQWIIGQATDAGGQSRPFIARYCDDTNGAACDAAPSVLPFTLGASASALSVAAGSSATTTLTITPRAGFTDAVTIACSGLPAGAACSFAPSSVTPAGGAAATTLTIATDGGPVALWLRDRPGSALALLLPVFGLWRPNTRIGRRRSLLAAALLLPVALVVACGGDDSDDGGSGGGTPPPATGTPAGSSTVTVTATSGSGASAISRTLALTLTVTR